MIYLFLDDIRDPKDAYIYTKNNLFLSEKWIVVRNYNQFSKYIVEFGVPDYISFDHDLADEHYVPKEHWDSYEASKKYQEEKEKLYKEKTGYNCAQFLIEYCMKYGVASPSFFVHSMNPIGKDNIEKLLNNFKNYEVNMK